MEEITVTTDISGCAAFTLTGPARIRADDLQDGDTVTVYEQRVDLDYEPAKDKGVQITLTKTQPSKIVEGYGSYKCLGSKNGLAVGYES